MTLTWGDFTYSPSTFSTSRASCVGVLPTATISSTSGVEILPSGRTGTVDDSSALRQTNTCKLSPGPMMYAGATGSTTALEAPGAAPGAAFCTGAEEVQATPPHNTHAVNPKVIQILRGFTGTHSSML